MLVSCGADTGRNNRRSAYETVQAGPEKRLVYAFVRAGNAEVTSSRHVVKLLEDSGAQIRMDSEQKFRPIRTGISPIQNVIPMHKHCRRRVRYCRVNVVDDRSNPGSRRCSSVMWRSPDIGQRKTASSSSAASVGSTGWREKQSASWWKRSDLYFTSNVYCCRRNAHRPSLPTRTFSE